ncbi:DNA-directed RNA polymerase I, subunit RPA34.5 [Metarhizium rileyi]|uniref:DNA-directed RNA polymerase I, subunit RPA34.5 n=1 Tax=Metarhizium rileyi (strain RCEF 4871) TaxID=1649241 RepID=A0A162JV98_METRR|nr:DNA-directed RNA polymerase I, subunit RPA34.5 [Metarhizium rileyi RCEF 4871]
MAPKKPYKVHSMTKHVESMNKGLSAEALYNKRPASKSIAPIKREPGAVDEVIFGGGETDDGDSDSSSSGSSDDDGSDFLRKLQATKTSTTASSKKPAKRDEIADSDDERRPTAKAVASVNPERLAQPGSSSDEEDSSSESESDSEPAAPKSTKGEPKVRANGAPSKVVARSRSESTSASGSEDEDDESSSDDEPVKQTTATEVNSPTSSGGNSGDRASESESEDKVQPTASTKRQPATKHANGTSTATTSETSSSDEGTDDDNVALCRAKPSAKDEAISHASSDDSSGESSREEDADVSMHIADRQKDHQTTVPDFIAPDFILRKSDGGSNGQDVARMCNQANLQGKQVWYFTVPANVPISVVQNMEIPMNQSQRGNSIFSHDGEDYGISLDSMTPKSSIQILIPSVDGARYQPAPRSIDQVMQIKKITQLGENTGNASAVGPAPKPAPRQQPRGLKARYQPYGVKSPMGQIGIDLSFQVENDDAEMVDAPPVTIPSSIPHGKSEKKDRKKKQKEKERNEPETPRKGKRKHGSSEDDAVAAAEQLMKESMSVETKNKKQKTQRDGSPDLGSDAPSSSAVSAKRKLVVPSSIPASTPSSKPNSRSKIETPATKPRETAVPIPHVPGSSQPKVSPVPVPRPVVTSTPITSKDEKKARKKKAKTPGAAASSQQSPPPSAQSAGKSSKNKLTPVPMPKIKNPA